MLLPYCYNDPLTVCLVIQTEQSSSPSHGTTLLEEIPTAQQYIDELKGMGINKIVLLTHVGISKDLEMASALSGVDVIVGGDSHTLLGDKSQIPSGWPVAGSYPYKTKTLTTNKDGKTVCIVQAWEYAHVLGHLRVSFDKNGDVTACSGTPVLPVAELSTWVKEADGSTLTDTEQSATLSEIRKLETSRVVAEDCKAQGLIDARKPQVDALKQEVIAQFDVKACFERIPGQGRSTICDVCESYHRGGAACNVVAKAFLMQEPTADIAIQSGGGCRTDIKAGAFTMGDAYTMLPFKNRMVTIEMTGTQIKQVLEDALENGVNQGSTGAYPYAAGLRYDIDRSKPANQRVSRLQVNPRLAAGTWVDMSMTKKYTVVTNDYISRGKDGYATFGSIKDKLNTYKNYAQSFIDFLKTLKGCVFELPYEEYSTQNFIDEKACDHGSKNDCGLTGEKSCAAKPASSSQNSCGPCCQANGKETVEFKATLLTTRRAAHGSKVQVTTTVADVSTLNAIRVQDNDVLNIYLEAQGVEAAIESASTAAAVTAEDGTSAPAAEKDGKFKAADAVTPSVSDNDNATIAEGLVYGLVGLLVAAMIGTCIVSRQSANAPAADGQLGHVKELALEEARPEAIQTSGQGPTPG